MKWSSFWVLYGISLADLEREGVRDGGREEREEGWIDTDGENRDGGREGGEEGIRKNMQMMQRRP